MRFLSPHLIMHTSLTDNTEMHGLREQCMWCILNVYICVSCTPEAPISIKWEETVEMNHTFPQIEL